MPAEIKAIGSPSLLHLYDPTEQSRGKEHLKAKGYLFLFVPYSSKTQSTRESSPGMTKACINGEQLERSIKPKDSALMQTSAFLRCLGQDWSHLGNAGNASYFWLTQ